VPSGDLEYLTPLRDALVEARRRHATVAAAGLPVPRTDDDAYAMQQAVADATGLFAKRPTAWKVGAGSRSATPSAAPLPAQALFASPARFAPKAFNRILIEGEVAFRLRSPLEGDALDGDRIAIVAAIGELLVTIEVVDPRYEDFENAAPLQRLADHGLHGALVIGTGIPWQGSLDWASQVAILRCDGNVVRETRGGHPLGDLTFMMPWIARHAAARNYALAAGDVITLGTWTGVYEASPGHAIDVEFPGIGRASVRFD
jgi:2-keto-4-pentenoate hydratase